MLVFLMNFSEFRKNTNLNLEIECMFFKKREVLMLSYGFFMEIKNEY